MKIFRRIILIFLFISWVTAVAASPQSPLTVSFLDVGQADSILIQSPNNHYMLVDAGSNETGSRVLSYLHSRGIKRIDVLVATHPHEDHIGGMAEIVREFEIGKIYMSKVSTTTRTFDDLLTAIHQKGLKISMSKAGVSIDLDPVLKIGMLAPNSASYENMNDYSGVIKLVYHNTSFLLTGDASQISEREMLRAGFNLKADVLKIGHHGSNTSTTGKFLKAVSPASAVISVGAGNDYGHPGKYTVKRLRDAGVKLYRTDKNGTIIMKSDGNRITVNVQK